MPLILSGMALTNLLTNLAVKVSSIGLAPNRSASPLKKRNRRRRSGQRAYRVGDPSEVLRGKKNPPYVDDDYLKACEINTHGIRLANQLAKTDTTLGEGTATDVPRWRKNCEYGQQVLAWYA